MSVRACVTVEKSFVCVAWNELYVPHIKFRAFSNNTFFLNGLCVSLSLLSLSGFSTLKIAFTKMSETKRLVNIFWNVANEISRTFFWAVRRNFKQITKKNNFFFFKWSNREYYINRQKWRKSLEFKGLK